MPNPFTTTELIPDEDNPRLVNAVLKYQVKTILQEGIVEIKMTLGELEMKSFQQSQTQLSNAHLPHFVKVSTFRTFVS